MHTIIGGGTAGVRQKGQLALHLLTGGGQTVHNAPHFSRTVWNVVLRCAWLLGQCQLPERKQSRRQRRGDNVSSETWKQMVIRTLCIVYTLCLRWPDCPLWHALPTRWHCWKCWVSINMSHEVHSPLITVECTVGQYVVVLYTSPSRNGVPLTAGEQHVEI